ncbi:hypothetical protein PR048_031777 [Dryococelus australis]|uniref:Uncharacterized protein n=1 Tax=Dryococelus australis TaxID=614101 RepID=A0ABQ9G688_9NEOP|nr:hypothetical protein PR048_031777 [Dryococelus australis]
MVVMDQEEEDDVSIPYAYGNDLVFESNSVKNGTSWADYAPPSKADGVRFPMASLTDFCAWESCQTRPLVGGFSRGTLLHNMFGNYLSKFKPQHLWTNRNKKLQLQKGGKVAERFARSPPTKANRVQSPAGSPDFRKWESCRWSAGFLGDLPFPQPLHSGAAPYSLQSPSSALKTTPSLSRAAQISSLTLVTKCTRPACDVGTADFTHADAGNGSIRNVLTLSDKPSASIKPATDMVSARIKSRGNERSLRKPADQWHHPTRFPNAKIWERPSRGSNLDHLAGRLAALLVRLRSVCRGHGGVVVRLLCSHKGDQGSIAYGVAPGFLHVGIEADVAAGRRVFSGIFPHPFIPLAKTSFLVVALILPA